MEFVRGKTSPHCLSAWQITQLVMQLADQTLAEASKTHMMSCADCRLRFAHEQEMQQQGTFEQVPPLLLKMAEQKPSLFRTWTNKYNNVWGWGSFATATALALSVVVLVPREARDNTTRSKGQLEVLATVKRQNDLVADKVALGSLPPLQTDDVIRLYVAGSQSWVKVEGLETEGWRVYFHGLLPQDRWLPIGIAVTSDGSHTKLRFTHCVDGHEPLTPEASGRCETKIFELLRQDP